MQIKDIINQKKQQYVPSTPIGKKADEPPQDYDKEWEDHKNRVMLLKGNYTEVLTKVLDNNPALVKTMDRGDYSSYTIEILEAGDKFETQLVISEHKDKGVQKVYYIAFNKKTNTCFVRDIIGTSF